MKVWAARLGDWVDARSLRERVLLFGGGLVIVFLLWNALVFAPSRRHREDLGKQIETAREQLSSLQASNLTLAAKAAQDPNAALRKQAAALHQEIAALDARVERRTATLIPPAEMAQVLERVLAAQHALRLVKLTSLAPKPLFPGAKNASSDAAAKSEGAGVYEHGFVLEVRGGYLATLRYLQALQKLPWSFFWDRLDYEVTSYPDAKITIQAHTLSTREGWIGG